MQCFFLLSLRHRKIARTKRITEIPPRTPQDIVYEEKLGEGDCAVVYKARWRSMSVVSKMLRNVGTDHETDSCLSAKRARADLMNEISLLSHLRHP